MRQRASRPNQSGRFLSVRFVILTLVGFLLTGAAGAGAYFLPALAAARQISDAGAPNLGAGTQPSAPAIDGSSNLQPFTVLLLGSDNDAKFDPNQVLTQSMILVRIDPVAHKVTMFSIARDLYVPIPQHGTGKIDQAYAYGGAKLALATVQQNFQVRIDNYVWIGLEGLVKLIDMVGGVDVVTSNPVLDDYYPDDIHSGDAFGYTRVAVLPGAQHLDGIHAMQYVRSRHSDLRGDFGRSVRQQQVLLALRSKAKTLTAADIPDLATTFNGQMKTDMSLDRIRALLPIASKVQTQDVKQQTMLSYTVGRNIGGEDVLLASDWAAIRAVVHQDFPP